MLPIGPGIIYHESQCWDWNQERILFIPANETGTGPYLVTGLNKVQEIFHWSGKWDQELELYCRDPVDGNETGNFQSQ